jgi:hypothetical protein
VLNAAGSIGARTAETSEEDLARWRADVQDGLTPEQLAERWGNSERHAKRRVKQVRPGGGG